MQSPVCDMASPDSGLLLPHRTSTSSPSFAGGGVGCSGMWRSWDCSSITLSPFRIASLLPQIVLRTLCPSSTLKLPGATMFLTLYYLRRLCYSPDFYRRSFPLFHHKVRSASLSTEVVHISCLGSNFGAGPPKLGLLTTACKTCIEAKSHLER